MKAYEKVRLDRRRWAGIHDSLLPVHCQRHERPGGQTLSSAAEERAYIADHILNELEMGIVSNQTATHILKIMERMAKEQQIEAIVLGCTELPLLFEARTTPIPLLDTMQIHINALIDTIMEE